MNLSTAIHGGSGKVDAFSFGPFRYDAIRRELFDATGPVRIGSRALLLLDALLETPGQLLSRDELVSRVWQNTVVEETSLRVHMSALRRLLGDGQDGARYIKNVPGRGYAFVADVTAFREPHRATPEASSGDVTAGRGLLPSRLTHAIGRGPDIDRIGALLRQERLVSIIGTGGMGKTTVASAVAERQHALLAQGAVFVDLSTFVDPALVVIEVGQCCGVDVSRGEPWAALEDALRDRQTLIVLDNCEHVIHAAATLADRLLRRCPGLRILATSREPLEVEAEWVVRLPPLDVPQASDALALDAVLAFPAIQLFVERARAGHQAFQLTDDNVASVRQLCEFLDGIPLAIELAAARVASVGVHAMVSMLEDALEMLTRGQRTARSRHQTLRGVLHWSYQLLTADEKLVLQRLSVFRSTFNLEGTSALCAGPDLPHESVIDGVLNLFSKSLLARVPTSDGIARYRLLYVTRLFASRVLEAATDAAAVHRRHACFVMACLHTANNAREAVTHFRRSPAVVSVVGEMRAALEWALLEENDLLLGLQLVTESTRAWHTGGLVEEYRLHVITAIDKAPRAGAEGERLKAQLQMRLTFLSSQTVASAEIRARAAVEDRGLIDRFETPGDRLQVLFALCASAYGQGDFLRVLGLCDEVRELAQGEHAPLSVALGDRFSALALHQLGQHDAAERLAHRVMACNAELLEARFQSIVPFTLSMRIRLARIHWLRGDFRQAWAMVEEFAAVQDPAHFIVKCQPLAKAVVPIAIWKGELGAAARWSQELLDHATASNLPYWKAFGDAFCRLFGSGPRLQPLADADLPVDHLLLMDLLATLQQAPPHATTLERVQQGQVGWCAPEVLRLAALVAMDGSDASRAACLAALGRAHELSVEQGARFWSLRIAISLCDVAQAQTAEHATARRLLEDVFRAIDDGSAQPDLQRARALLSGHLSGHLSATE